VKRTRYGLFAGAALALAAGLPAQAAQSALSEYEQRSAMKQIEEEHKAATGRCATLRDDAERVCRAEADGRRNTAQAQLKLQQSGTAERRRDLARAQADAQYGIESRRCDERDGVARAACQRQAKMNFERAMAAIRADRERSSSTGSGRP
jgi:hypothetical protein